MDSEQSTHHRAETPVNCLGSSPRLITLAQARARWLGSASLRGEGRPAFSSSLRFDTHPPPSLRAIHLGAGKSALAWLWWSLGVPADASLDNPPAAELAGEPPGDPAVSGFLAVCTTMFDTTRPTR